MSLKIPVRAMCACYVRPPEVGVSKWRGKVNHWSNLLPRCPDPRTPGPAVRGLFYCEKLFGVCDRSLWA